MKLFKSICSVTIVCVIVLTMALCAFAYSDETFSITIPSGFTEFEAEGQLVGWQNADSSIIVNVTRDENTSNIKVNPNDAGDSYKKALENEMKSTVESEDGMVGEVVSIESGLMELGEHDAIRIAMAAKYTFGDGEMMIYQFCYLFETENYIHAVCVTGDENVGEFADELIRTININDEAIERRTSSSGIGSGLLKGVLKGAAIGVVVGIVLAVVQRNSKKKKAQQAAEIPTAEVLPDEASSDETNETANFN